MPPTPPRRRLALLAAGAALLASTGAVQATAAAPGSSGRDPSSDAVRPTGLDSTSAIVELSRPPLATSPRTAPAKGKKLDFGSTAVKNERAALSAQRNDLKKWLRANAAKATVTGEYDVALNAVAVRLNGTALSTLRGAPGVVSADYEQTYSPTADALGPDPDLARIDAKQGWLQASPGSPATAGRGTKVGVVDTGIDISHPCFSGAGFPNTPKSGDPAYTNNKVVVARVFANKAANLGYTAKPVQDHGTHVAGTVACNAGTPARVDGVKIPYDPSGVAPGAQLGSYNVFPGDITNARSEDILNALQAAAQDGMDVINMSLGGNAHGNHDLLTNAVDNLDRANIVVAVSAGNDGPGHYTVGSPGSAERALTAGASSVGHFIGIPVLSADGAPLAVTASGDFPTPTTDLTAPLVLAGGSGTGVLGDGCEAGDFGATTNVAIALVSRGTCTFGVKVANAEKAGAVATIVVNNVPGDPVAMAADETAPSTIPAVMAGLADRAALVAQGGKRVTIAASKTYTATGNDDIMGDFSSQGPTDVSYRVKPDLTAPGVNVLSSIPQSFCTPLPLEGCWAFFQGTSMASPHLAGTAAVVRAAHPGWSAAQVRSAITNTAKEGVLTKSRAIDTPETDPLVTGAGLDDVDAAVGARLALSSVSTSFGAVPSGSGQTLTRPLTVTNLTAAPVRFTPSVTGDPAFSVPTAPVTVPGGGSATVTVSYNPGKAVAKGDHSATLRLGSFAHSVLYGFAK